MALNKLPGRLLTIGLGLVALNILFFTWAKPSYGFILPPFFGSLGMLLTVLVATLGLGLVARANSKKLSGYAYLLIIIPVFLSLFRGSLVDRFLLNLVSYFSFVVFYLSIFEEYKPGDMVTLIFYPFLLIRSWLLGFLNADVFWRELSKIWPKRKRENTSVKASAKIIRAIIITLPVIFFISLLLSQSDPIFSYYLKKVISVDLRLQKVALTLTARIIFSFFFVIFTAPFIYSKVSKWPVRLNNGNREYSFEYSVLLFSISAILGIFLVVQYKYLFTTIKLSELSAFGISTYSEYVRKGFAELILVSSVIYSLLTLVSKNLIKRSLKFAVMLVGIETIILIISVFRRVYLYVDNHGMTLMRFYGSIFLIMLFVLVILALVRGLTKISKVTIFKIEIISALIVILVGTNFNIEKFIVSRMPPTVNEKVDSVYIADLSGDAYQGWIESWGVAKSTYDVLRNKGSYSDQELEELYGAYVISGLLREHYLSLAFDYGDREVVGVLSLVPIEEVSWRRLGDIRRINVIDYQIYKKLKKEMDYRELNDVNNGLRTIWDIYRFQR